MRHGPKGEKCSADVIGNAVHVVSLAIGASISDTLWAMTDLVEMIEVAMPKSGKHGPRQKQAA